MTKTRIWMMLLTALVISVVIAAGSMAASVTSPEPAAEESAAATTQINVSYVLRAWDGHIGLFRGDSERPYQELDMPLTLLSDYDRKMVEAGITVETERELRMLVEDLTS
ncbi:MAG: hypothetical protein IJ496_02635 [Ruminococcus sp.]|nr:hypothetical protein [Ruminococcus sp.]